MTHQVILDHDGVLLPVEYEFSPGHFETRTEPADPPSVTILRIQLNGVWVDPDNWIFPTIVDEWCERLLEGHEE